MAEICCLDACPESKTEFSYSGARKDNCRSASPHKNLKAPHCKAMMSNLYSITRMGLKISAPRALLK
ncbi:hypothetical protein NQ317_009556 [Molorchus minor]|uniref:Uncharacterized protein n=1 Tax=Molorchus minor TaxID=1323400 RepID=A0ABQ9JGM3_9CUCU|nr:hypothetical protein NQ317_009556 [Molorchus minor]